MKILKTTLTFTVLLGLTFSLIGCDKLPKYPPGKIVFQTNRELTKEEKIEGLQKIAIYNQGEIKIVYEGFVYLPRWRSSDTFSFQLEVRNALEGKQLLINKKLLIIDLHGNLINEVMLDMHYWIKDYNWHPDGETVAAIENEDGYYAKERGRKTNMWDSNRVSLYNVKNGERSSLLEETGYRYFKLVYSPDGKSIYLNRKRAGEQYKYDEEEVVRFNIESQKTEVLLEKARFYDISKLGNNILFDVIRKRGTPWAYSKMGIYNLTSRKAKYFHKRPLFMFSAAMAPDEESVIYQDAGKEDKLWWVNTKGGKRKLLLDYSHSTENQPIKDMHPDWVA